MTCLDGVGPWRARRMQQSVCNRDRTQGGQYGNASKGDISMIMKRTIAEHSVAHSYLFYQPWVTRWSDCSLFGASADGYY